MKKTLTCIECPVGCLVTVEVEGEKILSVVGNACPRGKAYAETEVICPRRIVTSTVRSVEGKIIPVKTDRGVKKSEIFSVMERIKNTHPTLPVRIGEVLQKEIAEGCNLIATAEVEEN